MLNKEDLAAYEKTSIVYHDIFDYPLSFSDLIKWKSGKQLPIINSQLLITNKRGFYFLEGREGLIYKRLLRKRISVKKMKIAKKTAKLLSFVPGIKMVGITGSLAMENSSDKSDIDLIIVTKNNTLWTTRLLTYLFIFLFRLRRRNPYDLVHKDKLCLNMWLDEGDLVWHQKDRNLYTAHEIAQIVPLINKDKIYERFVYQNKWILDFWPNALKIKSVQITTLKPRKNIIEILAYKIQYLYMKNKISREVITPTRALFHPQDRGKIILSRLSS